MMTTELQLLKENRLPNETLNTTKDRLHKEGKYPMLPQAVATTLPVPAISVPTLMPAFTDEDEGLYSSDLRIPRWKIVQPTSRMEGAKEGTFCNTLTGETKERLENIVFLIRKNGRVMFPKDDYSGTRTCWPYDGIAPASEEILKKTTVQPKSEQCVSYHNREKQIHCPFAAWSDGSGNECTPRCKETIAFLGVDEWFCPFWIIFHGSTLGAVKGFISAVYLKKKQAMLQSKELHLRDFRVTLSLKLETTEKGKFFVTRFDKTEEVTKEPERIALTKSFLALSQKRFVDVGPADVQPA